MFRDTEKELQRLEEELLEEENELTEEEEIIQQFDELMGEDPLVPEEDRVYNADLVDEDPEELSQAVLTPKKEKLTGLTIAALLLVTAILGVCIWWVVQIPPELWKMLWSK